MEGKRPAKLNFLFSSSLHSSRVYSALLSVGRLGLSETYSHSSYKSWICRSSVPYFIECGEERFGEDGSESGLYPIFAVFTEDKRRFVQI